MSRREKTFKKEQASSDRDDDHLTTINEEELPEVSGEHSPQTNAPIVWLLSRPWHHSPSRTIHPAPRSFSEDSPRGFDITQHLIQAHSQAVQSQHEEMLRLQRKMQDMQDKIDLGSNRTLTSMETPRAVRPQDVEYQSLLNSAKKIKEQQESRTRINTLNNAYNSSSSDGTNDMAVTMQAFLANMSSVLKNNNKSRDSVTELPKFQGADTQWPKWYQLLRAYLQAKGWLTTFDHPLGPGTAASPTPGFDIEINEEIYQKLQYKYWDGTAITYIRMTAKFDGHGAGKQLKERYNKRSPQFLESYKKLAKEIRHVSGTSMPAHVDQFEAILSYMPEYGYVPTSSDRFEWFLPSVTEGIYASAKTLSLTQQINGALEWGNLVHLFNHTCYQQYPHFQVAELQSHNKSKLSQNSLKLGQVVPCPLHPDSQHTSADCKKLRELASSTRSPYPGGKGKRGDKGKGKGKRAFSPRKDGPWTPRNTNGNKKGKGYGGGKGKDKGNRTYTADTPNPFKDMECSHCGKKGHPARNCYKRLNAATTTVSQNNTTVNEPTTIAFQQFGTFMKRKTEQQHSEDDDADNTVTDAPEPTTTDAPLITDLIHPAPVTQPSHNEWGSSSASFQPTWGNNDKSEQDFNDDEWGHTDNTATGGDNRPINYSPERNPTRSGICCYCEIKEHLLPQNEWPSHMFQLSFSLRT
jgi:hypothetical protein